MKLSKHSFPHFDAVLRKNAKAVERVLDDFLSLMPCEREIIRPERLLRAMRLGVFNGGKRLRPFLLLETAALFDGDADSALYVAAALECVHCYSLIHDDLPAMDNDGLRRGKPTLHKIFDEGTAILAGDALLTIAFDIIADEVNGLSAQMRSSLILFLARASGVGGMAGGQMLDLVAGHSDEEGIIRMQAMKTGALLRFACEAGAMIAHATRENQKRLAAFGRVIGLAFQLVDDLLDITENTDVLGKTAGKDVVAGKITLVSLYGVEWVRRRLDLLIQEANNILEPYGRKADLLRKAAFFISCRNY
ncbi:MAG: farnesyl diphosphate synthase [Candidatus Tokpelaia sp. JSC161]|jgi:farnesyl diphosphate synthase|nr:MAG: farnesyl diphosphate synthase [Candidatus Tokpelaia sp. JSC161]